MSFIKDLENTFWQQVHDNKVEEMVGPAGPTFLS
jgi:hypothetical protein